MIAACALLAAALLSHRWAGRVLAHGVATVELYFDTRALAEGFRDAELAVNRLADAWAEFSDGQLDLLDRAFAEGRALMAQEQAHNERSGPTP